MGLLVLTRQRDESVQLVLPDGSTIFVVCVGIVGKRCKLAFDAPADVQIIRSEIPRDEFRKGGAA